MTIATPIEEQLRGHRALVAGVSYVVYDINAGEMLLAGECHVEQVEPAALRPWEPGMKALLTRPGGYGDMLFLTPTISALNALGVEVHVCCSPTFQPALAAHPGVAGLHDYPMSLEAITAFDQCVWMEGILERGDRARTTHAVDLMAAAAGVELNASKRCELFIPDASRKYRDLILERFPSDLPRIGIQVSASQAVRTYPAELLKEVIAGIVGAGAQCLLFGLPKSVAAPKHDRIVNLTMHHPAPTFLDSCAILETCNAFIAPDSALCHAAGALNVPTVALYGPFPWNLRTSYHPSVRALTGACDVSPCFHHERGPGTKFPVHGPCVETGRCEALAEITPKRIVTKALELGRQNRKSA